VQARGEGGRGRTDKRSPNEYGLGKRENSEQGKQCSHFPILSIGHIHLVNACLFVPFPLKGKSFKGGTESGR